MPVNPLAQYLPSPAQAPEARPKNPLAEFLPNSSTAFVAPETNQSYLGEMVSNIPASAADVGRDLWQAVSSPVQTAKGLGDVLTGAVQKATDLKELGGDADKEHFAEAAGRYYKDRYGGMSEIADTFREDPVGTMLDATGLLGGGAAAGARLPGVAGRLAQAITKADPVAAVGRGAARGAEAFRTRAPSNKQFIAEAPSPDELQGQASPLFQQAEKSGVRFKADYFRRFADDTLSTLVDEGADTILSPKVSRVADLLEKARDQGRSPSIAEMSILRRQFGNAADSADAAERRLAGLAIDRVDDFVENSAGHVGAQLGEARALWSRLKKSEIIDTAIQNAEAVQAGIEAGLRNEFKALYKARNSKKMRGFTKDEMAAIKKVAMGDFGSNTLRRIGSLGGGSGTSKNMLNLLVGTGAGAAVGGPIGAVAVPLAGYGAQRAATAMTKNRADLARAITARGETPQQATVPKQRSSAETFLIDGARQRYPQGAAPIAAPLAVGPKRYQDDPGRSSPMLPAPPNRPALDVFLQQGAQRRLR